MNTTKKHRVCPWWLGYAFLLPFRKYKHDPEKILAPHIKRGMKIMDYGSAMGYFSIPLAQFTGPSGKVYCVDIQEKMLSNLQKRAKKYEVDEIIETLLVNKNYNPSALTEKLDFVLLFAVAHEVPDQKSLFEDLYKMLKKGGKILFAEPKGHVSIQDFNESTKLAHKAGFQTSKEIPMKKGLSVFLIK